MINLDEMGCGMVSSRQIEQVEKRKDQLFIRPTELPGCTYKIKTPMSEHALYVTINDVEVPGNGRRPREIFINSKNMENFPWVVALTRVMSAIFRSPGDPSFLVEELQAVFDPRGGYYQPGGKYIPSVVAEIGGCLKRHLEKCGMDVAEDKVEIMRQPILCPKCGGGNVRKTDGCLTCTDCGFSKCD